MYTTAHSRIVCRLLYCRLTHVHHMDSLPWASVASMHTSYIHSTAATVCSQLGIRYDVDHGRRTHDAFTVQTSASIWPIIHAADCAKGCSGLTFTVHRGMQHLFTGAAGLPLYILNQCTASIDCSCYGRDVSGCRAYHIGRLQCLYTCGGLWQQRLFIVTVLGHDSRCIHAI